MTAVTLSGVTVNAQSAATAWLNAFLAVSTDPEKPALYRTLSVEFFSQGVQFIGCDGTMLFRTWIQAAGESDIPMPDLGEAPRDSVVVMDGDKFAYAFMKTLLTAASEGSELAISVEPSTPVDAAPLGEEFAVWRLTLRALGQELHCKLYEQQYPDWRRLQFGLDAAELVDGMTIAPRMFATVGRLKGVIAIDCDFFGEDRQIHIHARGSAEMRGLLMPMRRVTEKKKPVVEPESDEEDEE